MDIKDIIQKASFLTVSVMPLLLISGETDVLMLSARYPPIKGSTAKLDIYDTACDAVSSRALIETEVAAAPEEATITANTGINASIKTLNP